MADRTVYTSTSTAPVTGGDYMNNIAEKLGILFDAIALPAATIVNSGNDYTITIDPTLDGDVVNGMAFYITPNATNTGAVRLRVTSSNPYYDVVDTAGAAIASDGFASTDTYLIAFIGGDFVIYSGAAASAAGGGGAFDLQDFTASGTWTKPAGIDAESMVLVECWGAGGGGGTTGGVGGGGGGGGYVRRFMRAGDLSATETVTIGSGGTAGVAGGAGVDGGNSTFGALLTGYGGGGGGGYSAAEAGGGGGGETSAGGSGTAGAGTAGGLLPGSSDSGGQGGATGGNAGANAIYGGGGGGGGNSGPASGGSSWYGGGGGGSDGAGAGGASTFGGAGGADAGSGSQPGGGGGLAGNGAAGQITVRTIS